MSDPSAVSERSRPLAVQFWTDGSRVCAPRRSRCYLHQFAAIRVACANSLMPGSLIRRFRLSPSKTFCGGDNDYGATLLLREPAERPEVLRFARVVIADSRDRDRVGDSGCDWPLHARVRAAMYAEPRTLADGARPSMPARIAESDEPHKSICLVGIRTLRLMASRVGYFARTRSGIGVRSTG